MELSFKTQIEYSYIETIQIFPSKIIYFNVFIHLTSVNKN